MGKAWSSSTMESINKKTSTMRFQNSTMIINTSEKEETQLEMGVANSSENDMYSNN